MASRSLSLGPRSNLAGLVLRDYIATTSACQPGRSASAVRKRIGPALAIVDDESLDGHGLHCVRGDANSGMADAGIGIVRLDLTRPLTPTV
jgi:hypothetical protein